VNALKNFLYEQVKHSQKISSSPLRPWVGCREDGEIVCAHCNCMAGAGEHAHTLLHYYTQFRADDKKQPSHLRDAMA